MHSPCCFSLTFPVSCLKWSVTSKVTTGLEDVSKKWSLQTNTLHYRSLQWNPVKTTEEVLWNAFCTPVKTWWSWKPSKVPYTNGITAGSYSWRLQGTPDSRDEGAQGWQKWVKAVLLIRPVMFQCESHYLDKIFSSTQGNRSVNIFHLCPEIIWAEIW